MARRDTRIICLALLVLNAVVDTCNSAMVCFNGGDLFLRRASVKRIRLIRIFQGMTISCNGYIIGWKYEVESSDVCTNDIEVGIWRRINGRKNTQTLTLIGRTNIRNKLMNNSSIDLDSSDNVLRVSAGDVVGIHYDSYQSENYCRIPIKSNGTDVDRPTLYTNALLAPVPVNSVVNFRKEPNSQTYTAALQPVVVRSPSPSPDQSTPIVTSRTTTDDLGSLKPPANGSPSPSPDHSTPIVTSRTTTDDLGSLKPPANGGDGVIIALAVVTSILIVILVVLLILIGMGVNIMPFRCHCARSIEKDKQGNGTNTTQGIHSISNETTTGSSTRTGSRHIYDRVASVKRGLSKLNRKKHKKDVNLSEPNNASNFSKFNDKDSMEDHPYSYANNAFCKDNNIPKIGNVGATGGSESNHYLSLKRDSELNDSTADYTELSIEVKGDPNQINTPSDLEENDMYN